MDDVKRQKIADNFKEIVEKRGKMDGDIKSALEDAAEHPERIYDEDDSFNFDGKICARKCNGYCCSIVEMVRVSPVDVDYIMKSKALKSITRSEFVDEFLDVFLGRDSLIPMAILRFQPINPEDPYSQKVCPLMEFVEWTDVDEFGIKKEKKVKGLCVIGQTKKPTICMLYPLGRMITGKDANTLNLDEKDWIFFSKECPATRTNVKVRIKDWVRVYKVKSIRDLTYRNEIFQMIKMLKEKLGEDSVRGILYILLNKLYYIDGKTSDKMKDFKIMVPRLIEMTNDFDEKIASLTNKDGIPTLIDDIGNKVKALLDRIKVDRERLKRQERRKEKNKKIQRTSTKKPYKRVKKKWEK